MSEPLDLSYDDLTAILEGDESNPVAARYPFYPFSTPGMPVPGPNFLDHAAALLGLTMAEKATWSPESQEGFARTTALLYIRALYQPDSFTLPFMHRGVPYSPTLVPGHYWDCEQMGPTIGHPDKPTVMVVGKHPGADEVQGQRNMIGKSGTYLWDTLSKFGMTEEELGDIYVCNLVRWLNVDPRGGALPAVWIKDCLPLLHQEFRLVRPNFVLCLGAEATRAVLGGTTVRNMIGRTEELEIPIHDLGAEPEYHKMEVMAVTHPAAVLRTTELSPQYEHTTKNFVELVHGHEFSDAASKFDMRYVYKLRELEELVDEILAQPGLKTIAVDGEWHGDHPGEPGAYLRSIQFSHKEGMGVNVVLRHAGGGIAFMPGEEFAIRELKRLLDRDDVQLIGSFFNADLPWLKSVGLDLTHRFAVPPTVEQIRGGEYAGGFDVGLAIHSYNETDDFKLEVMASRYCGAQRWDTELRAWLKKFCSDNNLRDSDVEGYGECPDEIFLPYGTKDAIYTLMLRNVAVGLLSSDRFGNDCWTPFHISMLAFPAFGEMGRTGVKLDMDRVDALVDIFMESREIQLAALREEIAWPEFNPRSSYHCVEFLFGRDHAVRRDKQTGQRISCAPEGAITLNLQPVKTTGARSMSWERVRANGQEDVHTPSTDKEVCGILAGTDVRAGLLRDLRLTDQVLKSVFRPPAVVPALRRGEELDEENPPGSMIFHKGRRVYDGGIASFICVDMRVRSSFSQVKETGRASSARPPLQNLSKRREDDYKRILKGLYNYKVRSFITSNMDPGYGEPTVLLEADYSGAELFGIAVKSRDLAMIDHCQRANLPDGDPNQYDIHSNIAVHAFRLDCEPTKQGLKDIGRPGLRVAAKNVIFGSGYGRSAEAISRQLKEEGLDVEPAEAQVLLDAIFDMYKGIPPLQLALRARVKTPGHICNAFGRRRRFIASSDQGAMGELERQALNFPFQSEVADAMSYALHYLYTHPRKEELGYKIVLQVHDAVVLEVPIRSITVVHDEIIPECLQARVSFRSCDLDGTPYTDSPEYRFGIDQDVFTRWGETMSYDLCDTMGVDHRFGRE